MGLTCCEWGGMVTRCCVAMSARRTENMATQRRVAMPPGGQTIRGTIAISPNSEEQA